MKVLTLICHLCDYGFNSNPNTVVIANRIRLYKCKWAAALTCRGQLLLKISFTIECALRLTHYKHGTFKKNLFCSVHKHTVVLCRSFHWRSNCKSDWTEPGILWSVWSLFFLFIVNIGTCNAFAVTGAKLIRISALDSSQISYSCNYAAKLC